jgi:uncharacterized protein DUF4266
VRRATHRAGAGNGFACRALPCIVRDVLRVMRVCVILLLIPALNACATTKAWQREDLAKPVMDISSDDPHDTLHAHLLGVREGAVGGFGGGGGGCGCH